MKNSSVCHALLKCLLIIILNAYAAIGLNAQPRKQAKMDSLFRIVNQKNDTAAISALLQLNNLYFFRGMFDSAIYYCRKGIDLSKKKNDFKAANLHLAIGKSYYMKSINDSALLALDESRPYLTNADDELIVNFNSVLASVYLDKAMTDSAISIFLQSIPILEKPENKNLKHLLFNTYANIGNVFLSETRYDNAMSYYNKANVYREYAQSKVHVIQLYQKKFIIFSNTSQLEEAEKCLDSSLALLSEANNLEMKQTIYVNYGFLFEKKYEYQKAKQWYLKGLTITDSLDNKFYRARIYNNLSSVSISLKDWTNARLYALEALKSAKTFTSYIDINYAYGNLKLVSSNAGNFKEALKYAELQFQYADSASNSESKQKVLELEAKYQNIKKEKEIADLKLTNTKKDLAVIKKNRLLLVGGITAAALLLIVSLLYRSNRQKRIIAERDKSLKDEQIKFLERQQQVVSLQSMINGQETERTRIAKDLHDGLGGLFSTIKMHFSTLQHERNELKEDPLFTKSYEMVNTASEEVRRIAHNMMPEVLIRIGLIQAVQELCNSISAGKLLNASVLAYGMNNRLNSSTEVMLFRIIQELLNNTIKHAKATEVIIQFNRENNRLTVTVEDNGRGFDMADKGIEKTAGLQSVESRVHYLNGKLSIDSQKELGTTIMMDFLINDGNI